MTASRMLDFKTVAWVAAIVAILEGMVLVGHLMTPDRPGLSVSEVSRPASVEQALAAFESSSYPDFATSDAARSYLVAQVRTDPEAAQSVVALCARTKDPDLRDMLAQIIQTRLTEASYAAVAAKALLAIPGVDVRTAAALASVGNPAGREVLIRAASDGTDGEQGVALRGLELLKTVPATTR